MMQVDVLYTVARALQHRNKLVEIVRHWALSCRRGWIEPPADVVAYFDDPSSDWPDSWRKVFRRLGGEKFVTTEALQDLENFVGTDQKRAIVFGQWANDVKDFADSINAIVAGLSHVDGVLHSSEPVGDRLGFVFRGASDVQSLGQLVAQGQVLQKTIALMNATLDEPIEGRIVSTSKGSWEVVLEAIREVVAMADQLTTLALSIIALKQHAKMQRLESERKVEQLKQEDAQEDDIEIEAEQQALIERKLKRDIRRLQTEAEKLGSTPEKKNAAKQLLEQWGRLLEADVEILVIGADRDCEARETHRRLEREVRQVESSIRLLEGATPDEEE